MNYILNVPRTNQNHTANVLKIYLNKTIKLVALIVEKLSCHERRNHKVHLKKRRRFESFKLDRELKLAVKKAKQWCQIER
jgi:hypothetical protein